MTRTTSNVKQTPPQGIVDSRDILLQRLLRPLRRAPWSLIMAVLLFCVALGFNLYRLGVPSIWFDEAFSVELARQPLPLLWHIIFGLEPNMELYYLFLHFWLALTGSLGLHPTEFVVRLPSAVFAALSTVVFFLLGRRFINTPAGIVGAGLYLLNDLQLTYAQQTRAYSLQLLFTILAWYALLAALSSDSHPRRWWACYVVSTILAIYTHLFSLFILLAQMVTVAALLLLPNPWRDRVRKQFIAFITSLVATGILIIPMLIVMREGAKTGWLPVPRISDLVSLLLTFSGDKRIYLLAIALFSITGIIGIGLSYLLHYSPFRKKGWAMRRDRIDPSGDLSPVPHTPSGDDQFSQSPSVREQACHPERSEGSDAPGTEILRCAQDDRGVGLTDPGRENSLSPQFPSSYTLFPIALASLCWLILPVVVSYVISQGSLRLFSSRYLVTIVPALILLIVLGVTVLPSRVLRGVVVLGLLAVALYAVPFYYQHAQVEDWNITRWLEQRYQSGDGLVCYDNSIEQGCQISVEYYLHAYPGAAHFTADSPGLFSWQNFGPANPAQGPDAATDPAQLAAFAAHHPRIFYIVGRVRDDVAAARARAAIQWLNQHYRLISQQKTPTVSIYLYATNAGH